VQDALHGYSSINAQRCRERGEHGAAMTQYMRFGDTIRIEILDESGRSMCGAIERRVERLKQ
jgi:fumarylacetoacetate (FAA) hydrolase